MAHLEAELARFEAELAGAPGQTALPGPPGSISYQTGPSLSPGVPRAVSPSSAPPQKSRSPYSAAPQAALPPRQAYPGPPPVAPAPYPTYSYPPPPAQSYAAPQQAQPADAAPYYVAPTAPAAKTSYVTVAAPAPYFAPAAAPAAQAQHTPHALAGVKAALQAQAAEAAGKGGAKKKPPAVPRAAGGERWWDASLLEWPENDFRIFVGDLGNEVNDDVLTKSFQKYSSFAKAKVVKDKRTNKSKGYGFVSFMDPIEGAKALREMDGKYVGNRPCKLRKSNWEERTNQQAVGKKRKGGPEGRPVNLKKHVGILHR